MIVLKINCKLIQIICVLTILIFYKFALFAVSSHKKSYFLNIDTRILHNSNFASQHAKKRKKNGERYRTKAGTENQGFTIQNACQPY